VCQGEVHHCGCRLELACSEASARSVLCACVDRITALLKNDLPKKLHRGDFLVQIQKIDSEKKLVDRSVAGVCRSDDTSACAHVVLIDLFANAGRPIEGAIVPLEGGRVRSLHVAWPICQNNQIRSVQKKKKTALRSRAEARRRSGLQRPRAPVPSASLGSMPHREILQRPSLDRPRS
jgi:hypothetical protein